MVTLFHVIYGMLKEKYFEKDFQTIGRVRKL